ncbi:phytase [Oceanihabitans sediminis]|uniref:3-phytase n=1 Tax=Oceanihabitans sediminis TaxID=1812012 RepID=A0A368P2Y4_9FLAO|nr:phytase [Oceanihabitans sediminis]MDX1279413.1 phytase [Oceanihabitans sediminis]RBP28433.1 3-phytase [Oceanihabitans sediminis]RCU56630.1 3-phytase [Oceanihabitans sediminis]
MIKTVYRCILLGFGFSCLVSCKNTIELNSLNPIVITEQTPNDTDDPAIWIHPTNPKKSIVLGTDKDMNGGLYAYDLDGKIINKVLNLKRPNNVDIAYGYNWGGEKIDIAVLTERKANSIRVFRLPDLTPIDDGGIKVFENEKGEGHNEPMGISLYTKTTDSTSQVYAIVGRKSGPSGSYLWQYELSTDENKVVKGMKVRAFGEYSGRKEIEAIAVDNALGFVYYSDETAGIRKYYADPELNDNTQLSFFGQEDAKRDHEGIAIYTTGKGTGYILVSDQQANKFLVYSREGASHDKHTHNLITSVSVSTDECDGAEATNVNLGEHFPKGMLVAMTNGKSFHFYDWRQIQKEIDNAL